MTPSILPLGRLLELLTSAPRRRFGLEAGEDYSIWDLNASYPIDPADFLSKGKATPFEGQTVFGKCLLTVCGGSIAYSDKEAHHGETH